MSEPRPHLGNVQALHRLRVLVVARDRRFQRMAGFMLARVGLHVSALRTEADVLPTIDRLRPDIVVLDGSESLSDAARTAASIEAMEPRTTVVLVADDDAIPDVMTLEVFPKWRSFANLAANLERMRLGIVEIEAEG
jgi:DNA-binding NtrC family response regulator